MSDTQPFRILRAGQPVNKYSQHALLSNLPFDVEDLEAQRTCHPLGRLSNLFQLHAIPAALFSFAQTAGLKLSQDAGNLDPGATASPSTALLTVPDFHSSSPRDRRHPGH